MVKREYTTTLIILISLALVGLIAIQLYWINSAITLEKQQFRESANEALANAVKKRDMLEVSGSVMEHDIVRQLVDAYRSEGEDRSLTVPMDSNLLREQVEVRDSVITEEGEERRFRIVEGSTADSMSGFYTYARIIQESFQRDIRDPGGADLHVMQGDSAFNIDLTSMRDEMVTLRVKLVNDILGRLFSRQYSLPLSQRIDLKGLDSLLESELKEAGISTDFSYSIRDEKNELIDVSGKAPHYDKTISTEKYRQNLFPDDPILNTGAGFIHLEFPNEDKYVIGRMWFMLLVSGVLLIGIIYAFYSTVTTIFRQKKLSVIKNDFINNMTHELKTPISTISLACEALSDPDVSAAPSTKKTYVNMINEENKRLSTLVERVLQTAILDKGELKLKKEELDIHELIRDVVKSVDIQVKKKGGQITVMNNASEPILNGDRVHLTNVLYNLVDNAQKYSDVEPEIIVETESSGDSLIIKVTDNGIGISPEEQKKIFDKLYRVPTGDLHDVKGFGLGLSYVRAIVEMHKGTISVQSEPGEGSTFTVKIPRNHE